MDRGTYKYKTDMILSDEFYSLLLNPYLDTLRKDRTKEVYRQHILTVCTYFYHLRGERYSFEDLDDIDAREYFLQYLSLECGKGTLSRDTYKLRLSACKNFAAYLERRIPMLCDCEEWYGTYTYSSPFQTIITPAAGYMVRTNKILSEKDIDNALQLALSYDKRLFSLLLLSFRMMLPQSIILSLNKSNFVFMDDNGRHVGIVTYIQKDAQEYKRIPADIVSYMEEYVAAVPGDHEPLFKNNRGNRMTPDNLSRLFQRFEKDTGCHVRLGQLRTKGIIDLVAHNPDSLKEIEDYTGLSKQMIRGYGEALDRIAVDCIADRGSYSILYKKEDI